eukprot:CAMPEP_0172645448 /NCGR_PEP_ID=MMETSP1068-20121228/239734_1 /TAXON_ID=35684 /ORGANISM="Pseudopedinella elastica, Strain CCMP716" /LENGTH=911 /DNA_ID=CAMNT_0013459685 /DNA_START=168 /DNA_END=2903 /DNA_ORIENTATION=+
MAARAMMNNQAARNVAMGQKRANHRTNEEEIEESRLEDARKRAEEAMIRYRNPDEYSLMPVKMYLKYATTVAYDLSYGKWSPQFDAFIIAVIILAGAMVGIQTYPDYECPAPSHQNQEWKDMTKPGAIRYCENNADEWLGGGGVLDQFIFYTFVIEVIIKIVSNGAAPWMYFFGSEWKWNNFDCAIVLLSIDEFAALLFGSGGGGNLMILRLFRLARLLKLVGKIKKLQSIVMGLIAGIKAAGYIAMLLFLVFYIFAIAGMMAFSLNDPFHFRSIPVALLSLFRAATMEDWTDIMYINIFGCDQFPSGIYYTPEAYKPEGALADHPFFKTWDELPNFFKCNHPTAQPGLSAFYWVFFIFVSAFVMLSLFVGAITIAMSEQMEAQDNLQDEEAERLEEEALHAALAPRAKHIAEKMKFIWNKYATATNDRHIAQEEEVVVYRLGAWSRFAELNKKFAENDTFQTFVTLTILAAGISVGVDTELQGEANPYSKKEVDVNLWYADTIINWIFTVEVVVKLLAEDWHPWRYFYDGWNKFDFVIVFTSWMPLMLEAGGVTGGSGLGALKLLRLLRLFRIMRVIKKLPELTVIVDALISGMESIGFIALILFVVFYLFAVGGMMLFASNDHWHFGRLHRALLTLFRIATFEDWTDVMYINVYGCSRWGYNDDDTQPRASFCSKVDYEPKWWAAFYFIIFIFLGSLVLLTLFVGVVTTSMEEAQSSQRNYMDGERDTLDYFSAMGVAPEAAEAVSVLFRWIDVDGGGEVAIMEFLAACTVVTEAFEDDFPPELLTLEENFGDDGSEAVPEKGNPFVLMKYVLNYMARVAGSQARFSYDTDEGDYEEFEDTSSVASDEGALREEIHQRLAPKAIPKGSPRHDASREGLDPGSRNALNIGISRSNTPAAPRPGGDVSDKG